MSQQELAEKLNVSNKTISKWECGNSIPDFETLVEIGKIFNVSLEEFASINKKTETCQINELETNVKTDYNKKFNKKLILTITIPILFVIVV